MTLQTQITRRVRRGFSFTEVLFAVMVLGLGFIMIAAMFPVTIKQTQSTMEESVGASTARAALAYLQTQAKDQYFPITAPANGPAQVFSPSRMVLANTGIAEGWNAIRGNYINAQNPRIAWVPLYMRGLTATGDAAPYAQVFIIAVKARNMPQYTPIDLQFSNATPVNWATLEPRRIANVKLTYDMVNQHGVMTFGDSPEIAAPGAYVIIASDQNTNPPRNIVGQSNGRIYRLGNAIDEAGGVWALAPDGDMIRKNALTNGPIAIGDDNDLDPANTQAYIVGRGFVDDDPAKGYGGPAQDIAVYTGFIRINSQVTP